jgi:hypothetical protein
VKSPFFDNNDAGNDYAGCLRCGWTKWPEYHAVVSLFHGRGSQPHHRAEVLPLLNHTGLTRKVGGVAE